MTNCVNCNSQISENYCSSCGHPAKLKRIDGHYIIHEIEHVLHFEKGILYTIRELLIRPGKNVRHFVAENRSRLVKPIIFIILTSLFYTLINHFFHFEEGYVKFDEIKKSSIGVIFSWIQSHYGYANIMMGVFISFWAKIFFKKYGYNFYEILILMCFVIGMGMLFYSIFAIFEGLTHLSVMQIGSVIGMIYSTWAIGQFFDKKKAINYVKAFSSYILGMVTFGFFLVLTGILIDQFIKH